MVSKPVFIVSDVHLGAIPPEGEAAFRRWLLHVKESASRLIINGDLFDFWFEYRRVVPGDHVRVLALLADLVDAGVPVLMLGGNHDWWGGRYLRDRIGIDFHREPVRLKLCGRALLLAHGDGLGTGDSGYRLLRRIVRSGWARAIFRWLHPDLAIGLADRLSGTHAAVGTGVRDARTEGGTDVGDNPATRSGSGQGTDAPVPAELASEGTGSEGEGRLAHLVAWAQNELARDRSLEIVLTGHSHTPAIVEVEAGRYYVNSGDWVVHRSYVTLDERGWPVLHEWSR